MARYLAARARILAGRLGRALAERPGCVLADWLGCALAAGLGCALADGTWLAGLADCCADAQPAASTTALSSKAGTPRREPDDSIAIT